MMVPCPVRASVAVGAFVASVRDCASIDKNDSTPVGLPLHNTNFAGSEVGKKSVSRTGSVLSAVMVQRLSTCSSSRFRRRRLPSEDHFPPMIRRSVKRVTGSSTFLFLLMVLMRILIVDFFDPYEKSKVCPQN